MRPLLATFLTLAVLLAATLTSPSVAQVDVATADDRLDTDVAEADTIVRGRVRRVRPMWETTEAGDRQIVSDVDLIVIETLKGSAPTGAVTVRIIGGTLDGLTMVSSLQPLIHINNQASVFSRQNRVLPGRWYPLDANGNPTGVGPTLAQIRASVKRQPK